MNRFFGGKYLIVMETIKEKIVKFNSIPISQQLIFSF